MNSATRSQILLRGLAELVSKLPLPLQVSDELGGLDKAEAISRQGCGLIVVMNHFSLRDAFQILGLLFKSRELRRRPILAPVAYHQHNSTVQFFGDRFAVRLRPVVTSKTRKLIGEVSGKGPNDANGVKQYLETAALHLKNGGIVILAPQGGRRSSLGQPRGRPVGRLLEEMERNNADSVGLMFVGLGIPTVNDYAADGVGGVNFMKTYEARIGRTTTAGEAIRLAGGMEAVDPWVFSCLAELVPAAYRAE